MATWDRRDGARASPPSATAPCLPEAPAKPGQEVGCAPAHPWVFPPLGLSPTVLFCEILETEKLPTWMEESPERMSLLAWETPTCFNSPWGVYLWAERSITLPTLNVSAAFSSYRWEHCSFSSDCIWESTLKLSRQNFLYFPETVLCWLKFCDFALVNVLRKPDQFNICNNIWEMHS